MKIDYTSKWLLQKVFAFLFLIASAYTIYSIDDLVLTDYEIVTKWLSNYVNSIAIFILFVSIFLHSNIGLTSIIDDYFHDQSIKKKNFTN